MRVFGFFALCAALIVACSSFGSAGDAPSSATDGGTGGADARAETGVEAGVSSFTCEGATYCDDFEREDPEPPQSPVTLEKQGDSVSTTTETAFHGTHSARISLSTDSDTLHAHYIFTKQVPPAKSTSLPSTSAWCFTSATASTRKTTGKSVKSCR